MTHNDYIQRPWQYRSVKLMSRTIWVQRPLQHRGELDSTNPLRWKLCRNRNDTQSSEWCSRALLLCIGLQHSSHSVKNYVSVRAALALGHGMYTCACITYVSVTRRAKSQNLFVDTFGLSLRLIICSPTHRIALRSRVQQRSSVRYVCAGCPFTTGPDFIFCMSMLDLLRSVVRPSRRSHGLLRNFQQDWHWEP